MGVVIGWLPLRNDSSGTISARKWPPADDVLIKVGVGAEPPSEDAPVARPCHVIGFPDPDCHRIGGRGLLVLDPEVHGRSVPRRQSDGIPIVHDGLFPAHESNSARSLMSSTLLRSVSTT